MNTIKTSIEQLEALKPFIEYIQQFNAKSLKIGDIVIEFDPHLSLLKAGAGQDLEEAPVAERMNQVRKTMEEITKEQNDEMFWSTGK